MCAGQGVRILLRRETKCLAQFGEATVAENGEGGARSDQSMWRMQFSACKKGKAKCRQLFRCSRSANWVSLFRVGKRIRGAPDLDALGSVPQCSDGCMVEQTRVSSRTKEGNQK